jgi:8-oxo-dGTP diphosphatase
MEHAELEHLARHIQRAAGGVLWREVSGRIEVAVIHRPHREDWSFPKGKLEKGETFEDAALRETLEETGLICELGPFLGTTEYQHRSGKDKVVAYFAMQVVVGEFVVNDEADELRWLTIPAAQALLTYEHDTDVLGPLLEFVS